MQTEFSSFDISKILKIPNERFRQWTKLGYIKPSVPSKGQGKRALYTLEDLYACMLFKKALSFGFHREIAAYIVATFLSLRNIWSSLIKEHEGKVFLMMKLNETDSSRFDGRIDIEVSSFIVQGDLVFESVIGNEKPEDPSGYSFRIMELPDIKVPIDSNTRGDVRITKIGRSWDWGHISVFNIGQIIKEANASIGE